MRLLGWSTAAAAFLGWVFTASAAEFSDVFMVTDANGNTLTDAFGRTAYAAVSEDGEPPVTFEFDNPSGVRVLKTFYLIDGAPSASGLASVSDVVIFRGVPFAPGAPGHFLATFQSNSGEGPLQTVDCTQAACIAETGMLQLVLVEPSTFTPLYVWIESEVPEPSMGLLVAGGLLGLAVARRRASSSS
jgi:hypothetical protein